MIRRVRTIFFGIVMLVAGGGIAQVQAAQILIDFGVFADSPDASWNVITDGTVEPVALFDSTGAASGLTLTFTSGLWKTWTTPTSGQAGNTPVDYFPASDDFLFLSPGESAAITISGLTDLSGYTFELVASRAPPGSNRSSNYTLSGADTETIFGFDATADGYGEGETLNWNLAGGIDTTTLSAGGSGLGAAYLNALIITPLSDTNSSEIAAPAPLPLMILGTLLLIAHRVTVSRRSRR